MWPSSNVRRRRAGGRLHTDNTDGMFGELLATALGGARRNRAGHRRRLPRRQAAQRDGFPGVVAGDLGQGHGKVGVRGGQYSGGVRRASMSSRAMWWWPTPTATPTCRKSWQSETAAKAQKRHDDEDGKRKRAGRPANSASTCTRCARGWRRPGWFTSTSRKSLPVELLEQPFSRLRRGLPITPVAMDQHQDHRAFHQKHDLAGAKMRPSDLFFLKQSRQPMLGR